MRVLHFQYDDVANPWVGGGGAVRAHEIYRRLTARHHVTVYTGNFPGASDEERDGVEYRRLGASMPYAWSRWTYARAATARLVRGDYDAAVVDYSLYTPLRLPDDPRVALNFNQLAGPTARRRFGRAIGGLLERIEDRRIGRARTISVMSEFLLQRVRPLARPGAAFHVVGAGVDDDLFAIERRESDYLLYYGRFDVFQKGIDRLIPAADALLAERPELRLVVAGRGRDADTVRAMVSRSVASARMALEQDIGPVRRAELFAGALALVMPSRFEGFGMVAAEAMAAGVPVVAANRDSLPAVVGDTGLLVDPESPAEIAAAVRALLDDAALRESLSARGRDRARRYSWDAVAGQHDALLRQLAGAGTQRPRSGQSDAPSGGTLSAPLLD